MNYMNLRRKFSVSLSLIAVFAGACASENRTPCRNPAKLEGHSDARAAGIFIAFKPGIDDFAAAATLAKKYHFTVARQYSLPVLIHDLDLKLIPSVRCEQEIDYLELNVVTTIGLRPVDITPNNRLERSRGPSSVSHGGVG